MDEATTAWVAEPDQFSGAGNGVVTRCNSGSDVLLRMFWTGLFITFIVTIFDSLNNIEPEVKNFCFNTYSTVF
jgi:hypothetical protein